LLEGLEATEVLLSYARTNNDVFRVDSNYFKKNYLKGEDVVRKKGSVRLCDLGASVKSFGAYSLNNEVHYLDSGIPFIRGVNMKNGRVNFSDMLYISPQANTLLWKSEVKQGMVLLSMSGTIGDVAIATSNWPYPVNSNQDIAKIDTSGAVNPFALYAYLLSRYGQDYLHREARGSVQQHVFLSQIEQLEVPKFSDEFAQATQYVIEISEQLSLLAEREIRAAEDALLTALGLDAWTPPEALSYVRQSSQAFAAGRLDAEHFQPRFAALAALISAKGNCERLGDKLLFNARGRQPEYADVGLPVINSKHVLRNEVRYDDDNRRAVFGDDSLLIQSGDVLINGTGVGTIGRAAAYLHEASALPDNHVTILRPNSKLDPVYLAVFLNSLAGQLQVDQRLRGSSGQIELYPTDIAEFQVWVAPKALQLDIRRLVEQSYAHRERATRLLDAAKRAAEIAIEDGEPAALRHLRDVL